MKRLLTLLGAALLTTGSMMAQQTDEPMATGHFEANWQSLKQWDCPEWFKDAKFGLWAHWGPQCQAESGDWYARFMYYTSNPYDEHRGINYNPREYGLKEFCRDFVAKKWNPKAIMAKYKAVGCKYFMALGNHHDNFDLWDSPYQEWNSVNVGMKRDVGKEWADAAREQGLRFGMSVHASHAWTWLEPSQQYDGNLTKEDGKGQWWEGMDPQELYAQQHEHSTGWENSGTIHSQWGWGNGASIPSVAYRTKLQNRCRQMVNYLKPDMVYFDDTVLPFYGCDDQWGPDFLAHYYNTMAKERGGDDPEVVVMGKILPDEQKEAMLWDVERGIPDRPRKEYWQTCTCIGDWHYKKSIGGYKSAATVIRMLVDIVSKNGNMLLSIPLNADGEYDAREAVVLDGIEAWMKTNGESIYGTRVWEQCFGEGPLAEAVNGMTAQGFNEGQNYTSEDVRYVTKGDTIYATIMAWPSAGSYTMTAFSPLADSYRGKVAQVELLGGGKVNFTQNAKGLSIDIPKVHPNDIAPVFRITFAQEQLNEAALLQDVTATMESELTDLLAMSSSISSGKYNTAKVQALADAVAKAKDTDRNDASAVSAALSSVRAAYQDLQKNGVNKGGLFEGSIRRNLTTKVLVEAENFSGTLTGRYGTLNNWTVENYNINDSRKGLDNYNNVRGISLGIWDDKAGNKGDLTNARIYRRVKLEPGTYYFGAAYNSLYGCNEKAYLFVSKQILSTDEIPSKSEAYYQLNMGKEGSDLYGLNVEIKEAGEYIIGWQANLDNGSNQQEFRATKVAFYESWRTDNRPTSEKLTESGWMRLEGMPSDLSFSDRFFAFVDHNVDLPIVARTGSNTKNWNSANAMYYAANADANNDASALFTIDAYTSDGSVAVGEDAHYLILTSMKDPSRHFRTEGWSKVVWQTYSDFGSADGNRDIAYVTPAYDALSGWTLRNKTSEGYVGAWDSVVENGAEFACNKSEADACHMDIYTITRSQWVQQFEDFAQASSDAPIDITCIITNPSFERYNEEGKPIGWTLVGDGGIESGWLSGCDGRMYMNNWQGSGKLSDRSVSQTLRNLPSGKYRLVAYSLCAAGGAHLFAGDNSVSMKHSGNADTRLDFDLPSPGDVQVGIRLSSYQSNDMKFDNIRLYYLGALTTDIPHIHPTASSPTTSRIYNLGGQQLPHPHRGINIISGRKVISTD